MPVRCQRGSPEFRQIESNLGGAMPSVLCIEDEAELRELIVEELQSHGYETLEARDGVAGLQMILNHRPDIVVCDIAMPKLSGIELIKTLRSDHPGVAETPFIFLTAFADQPEMSAGIEAGADDYLTKPIDFELLVSRVALHLRKPRQVPRVVGS